MTTRRFCNSRCACPDPDRADVPGPGYTGATHTAAKAVDPDELRLREEAREEDPAVFPRVRFLLLIFVLAWDANMFQSTGPFVLFR